MLLCLFFFLNKFWVQSTSPPRLGDSTVRGSSILAHWSEIRGWYCPIKGQRASKDGIWNTFKEHRVTGSLLTASVSRTASVHPVLLPGQREPMMDSLWWQGPNRGTAHQGRTSEGMKGGGKGWCSVFNILSLLLVSYAVTSNSLQPHGL